VGFFALTFCEKSEFAKEEKIFISSEFTFTTTTLEKGGFRLSCEAGLKECTADPPKSAKGRISRFLG
jgi:hypothetical protein